MKCSNPRCTRGIGLVSRQRGLFDKRRFCSRKCRDNFVVERPKCPQPSLSPQATSSGLCHGVAQGSFKDARGS
jgi:hypothetical protein